MWIARCLSSGRRMCIGSAMAAVAHANSPRIAIITEPPLLRWSESTHGCFPRQFRQEASALLLSWKRLSSSGGCAGNGRSAGCEWVSHATADLGALDVGLVRRFQLGMQATGRLSTREAMWRRK